MFARKLRESEEELLRVCVRKGGGLLVHIFDRGYASGAWLQTLGKYRVRFVTRWIKKHIFLTCAGTEKKPWQIGQGKKYLARQEPRDPATGLTLPCDLWWTQVYHPSVPAPLFVVKARFKQGVMYLITNEPVRSEAQAWEVFFTSRRR